MGAIRLQVISLEGEFLDESVDFFKFQGPMGETAILRNHAPLLTVFYQGLITYKTHGALAFSELPYDIKLLVTTKCLENQTCGYSAIPQFKLFQRELGIRVD